MPVLKNQKHEKFAQAVALGEAAGAAYQKVYRVTASVAETAGPRLFRNVQVSARIDELKANAAAKVEWSIAERLKFLREAAETPPDQLTLGHRVCQGQRMTKEGSFLLVPDKLKAVDLYSKLSGDYDREAEIEANGVTVRVKIGGNAS
jgi:hypothetical protein